MKHEPYGRDLSTEQLNVLHRFPRNGDGDDLASTHARAALAGLGYLEREPGLATYRLTARGQMTKALTTRGEPGKPRLSLTELASLIRARISVRHPGASIRITQIYTLPEPRDGANWEVLFSYMDRSVGQPSIESLIRQIKDTFDSSD